jgi:hypothetical protein
MHKERQIKLEVPVSVDRACPDLSKLSFGKAEGPQLTLRFNDEHFVQLGRALAHLKYGQWRVTHAIQGSAVLWSDNARKARWVHIREHRGEKRWMADVIRFDAEGTPLWAQAETHPINDRVRSVAISKATNPQRWGIQGHIFGVQIHNKYTILAHLLSGYTIIVCAEHDDDGSRLQAIRRITDGYRWELKGFAGEIDYRKSNYDRRSRYEGDFDKRFYYRLWKECDGGYTSTEGDTLRLGEQPYLNGEPLLYSIGTFEKCLERNRLQVGVILDSYDRRRMWDKVG